MQRFSGPFRQSDIERYLTCPRMFYYHSLLGIEEEYRSPASVIGTAVHQAILEIHKQRGSSPAEIAAIFLQALRDAENEEGGPIVWQEGEREERIKEALQMLHGYANREENRSTQVLAAEASWRCTIGRYSFEGTVDQIRRNNGTLILVDFKSGSSRPSEDFLRRSYQLSIYAYAMKYGRFAVNGNQIEFGQRPDEIWWYQLKDHLPLKRSSGEKQKGEERGEAIYRTSRSDQDLESLKTDLARVCQAIRMNIFYREPSQLGSCNGFCRYSETCSGELDSPELSISQMKAIKEVTQNG